MMDRWQQYLQFTKRYTTFSQGELLQLAGLSVFIFVMLFMYHEQRYGWRVSAIRIPRKFVLALWTSFILGTTLINRQELILDGLILNPMVSIGQALKGNVFQQYQVGSNILLFIPYGFLIPWNIWYCRRWYGCAMICFGTTLMIEMEQRITRRGTFDVADLCMNLLGAMIGFLIYKICELVRKPFKESSRRTN